MYCSENLYFLLVHMIIVTYSIWTDVLSSEGPPTLPWRLVSDLAALPLLRRSFAPPSSAIDQLHCLHPVPNYKLLVDQIHLRSTTRRMIPMQRPGMPVQFLRILWMLMQFDIISRLSLNKLELHSQILLNSTQRTFMFCPQNINVRFSFKFKI